MRLIDADALEPHEVYFNYGCQRIVYMDDIDEMPTIDAEPVKHGMWKYVPACEGADFGSYECSLCGEPSWFKENYCANCGARMDLNEVEK